MSAIASTLYQRIQKFSQIIPLVKPDTLLVLDIDETILRFDGITHNWWRHTFDRHYAKTKDYDTADVITYQKWLDVIHHTNPKHTDNEGLCQLLAHNKSTNGSVIFLTARRPTTVEITGRHFRHLGLERYINKIHYNSEKGEMLANYQTSHKHIVFIDDLQTNLDDVHSCLTKRDHPSFQLFQLMP